MPTKKAARLARDILALTVALRREAEQALKKSGNSTDPFERGTAIGYKAALDYSAEKLDNLLQDYLSTFKLDD